MERVLASPQLIRHQTGQAWERNMSMITSSSRRAVLKASVAIAAVATAGGILAACGENKPAEPVVDANPVVETKYGKVKGALDDGIATFKGVRYGADTTL
jgi:hypothetical protein